MCFYLQKLTSLTIGPNAQGSARDIKSRMNLWIVLEFGVGQIAFFVKTELILRERYTELGTQYSQHMVE